MTPDAKHGSTCCCPTQEMWELPTPLIVANRSQQGFEAYGSYALVLQQASWSNSTLMLTDYRRDMSSRTSPSLTQASKSSTRRSVLARGVQRYHFGFSRICLPPAIGEDKFPCGNHESSTCVTLNGSGIQLTVGPQPLQLRNHNFGLTHRIMVKRLETSPHDPLDISDSACKNQLVVVGVQYGPFYTYIPIRSTTIGKSRVARDPIAMHTSWRSNSDIASVTSIGYPRMKASGESSTTKHRLLHASGPHPIPPPNDPK
ncbi:hypothetical protein F511_38109 [Dorcoceras hygrometricum]|uniref:Uncharacterized protein n=1 Tax=Dorcoceras hygrometricum TaxID=472368 RepID=A0A2Z7BJ25_9LAMI|nr:hypothetical protein F511_38109 [Dorcoceras hygrometricum]